MKPLFTGLLVCIVYASSAIPAEPTSYEIVTSTGWRYFHSAGETTDNDAELL